LYKALYVTDINEISLSKLGYEFRKR
jgi:hypothetical protein